MLRLALVVCAAALLSACASLPSAEIASIAPAAHADNVNAPEAAPAPEPDVQCADGVCQAEPAAAPAGEYAGLQRRLFSPPSRRQPDQALVLATTLDRARRHARRRRARARRERRQRTAERRRKTRCHHVSAMSLHCRLSTPCRGP